MKRDPGSNYDMSVVYIAASVAASTVYSDSVDHLAAPSVSFIISVGTWATSFVATLQNSDDDTVWVDEADTTRGNEVSETIGAGDTSAVLNCPNPRQRYSRVKFVLGGTCVFACTAVLGPKRHVAVTDAT